MATEIVENDIASKFGNSPQKTGEPLDHAKLYSGKALEFDGIGDYLDTGVDLESWLEQDDKTMSVWVRNDGNTAEARVFNVGYSGSGSTGSTGFALGFDAGTDNKPFYFLRNESAGALKVEFGEVQPVGTWHYYVIVQDTSENEAYIYQNGVLMTTVSSVGVISQSTDLTAKIGKFWTLSELNYFKGALSNFQLWNKAWSTSDVQYAYTNPERLITDNASVTSGITTSDLELWYPMNDTGVRSPQTVVFDAAGTNNTTKNHATTTFLGDELNTNANATSPTNEANATTGWSSVNINVIQSQSSVYSVGSYALELNENAGPTNGARAYMDLEASPFSLVDGRTYTLSVLARHVGSGGQWTINAGSSTSNTSGGVIATITNSTTSFTEYTSTWVHDGDHRYINIQENSSDNDGGLYIDKLSIKEVGIASGWTDADQQQTIPQTALMNGSVKSFVGNGLYSNSIPSLSYPFTLSCWVYKTDDAAYGVYLVDQNVSTIYFGIALGADDKVYLQASNGSNKNTYSNSTYTSQWVHVVASFESATDRNLYINGLPNTDNENNDSVTYEDIDRISVGYRGASSPTYSGSEIIVDEVCVFSTGLNDSEALELYNNGAPLNATNHSLGTTNLVGYWQNNQLESTGKWKDQISTNHLTANDTPSTIFFQEGVTANLDTQGFNTNIDHTGSKGAVYFDGIADYIDLGKTTTIEGEFALEFWLKTDNPGTTENYIIGLNSNDFIFIDDNNTIKLEMNGSTETLDINDVGYHATDTLLVNEWVHIAITRNSDNVIKLYVNSQVQTDTSTTADNFDFRYIGFDGDSNYFKGWLDEFKVYDKELTSGQILKNYKHGKSKHKNS